MTKTYKHKTTGDIAELKSNVGYSLNKNTIGLIPIDYIEKSNDWELVVEEKKEWEILSFIDKPNTGRIYRKYNSNLFYSNDSAKLWYESEMLKDEDIKIHSIKRLSDGEIFTIGDKLDDKSFSSDARHILSKKDVWDNIITKIAIVKNTHNEVAGYGYTNMDGQLMFSASNKWKNLNVSLKDAKKSKPILFTTEDGVDIHVNQYSYGVYLPTMKFTGDYIWRYKEHFSSNSLSKETKYFSTEEKAKEYILMNKPYLSINDVNNAYPSPKGSPLHNILLHNLKDFVKSKL